MKYISWLMLVMAIIAGCKEDDESALCRCSGIYELYTDSTHTIFIPNSFTPNGDGINDLFRPALIGYFTQVSIIIKDGNNIVSSSPSGWDGTINGNPLSACQNFDYIIDMNLGNGITKHFENTITVVPNNTVSCPDSLSKCVFETQFDGTGFNPNVAPGDLAWCN